MSAADLSAMMPDPVALRMGFSMLCAGLLLVFIGLAIPFLPRRVEDSAHIPPDVPQSSRVSPARDPNVTLPSALGLGSRLARNHSLRHRNILAIHAQSLAREGSQGVENIEADCRQGSAGKPTNAHG